MAPVPSSYAENTGNGIGGSLWSAVTVCPGRVLMSWYDSVLANTVGVAYRAVSGNVDPWTLQVIKDDSAAGIAQALGPDADPVTVAAAQNQASNEVDKFLTETDSHPDQAGVRLPGLGVIGSPEFLQRLEKLVYGTIAVGAVIGLFYFSQRYGSVLKQTFRKR